jgi:hypothetical protein
MAASPEATTLRSALNFVLQEVQRFERERLVPPILVAIQATAQNVLYVKGVAGGYDWRDIHMRVRPNEESTVTIIPVALSPRANLLLEEVFKEVANEPNREVPGRDSTPDQPPAA